MFKFLIKIFITASAFILFALPVFAITASGPIITCGRAGQPFCNLCDIPVLIKNLIDYMTFYVALPLAAVMFVVAGYFYLIAGGSPQKVSQAREVFLTTIKGLGIVLLSWLVIAEIMVLLVGGSTTTAKFAGLSLPWNQLESPASCPFGTPQIVYPPQGGQYFCDNTFGDQCMIGGNTGIPCRGSGDTSCGGGGGQYFCDNTFGDQCMIGGNTGIPCGGPGDTSCGGGGQYFCDNTFGDQCMIGGNTGIPCSGSSDTSCGGGPPPSGYYCESNSCVLGGSSGISCVSDSNCQPPPSGYYCESNSCVLGGSSGISCVSDSDCQPPACSLTISDCGSAPPGYNWTINTSPGVCACWLSANSWITCWDLSLCGGEWRCKPNGNANGCSPTGNCCEPGSLPQ